MKTLTVLTATVISFAFVAGTQEIAAQQEEGNDGNTNSQSQTRAYSQAENISDDLPLTLIALNDPDALQERAVRDSGGDKIGRLVEVARRNSDQRLHAVVSLSTGAHTAIPLEELSLAALAYYDPARSLSDQSYVPAEFEQITQYQAGHSAWGSLTDPAVESAAPRLREDPDLATEPVGLPQQPTIEQQTLAEAAQPQTPAQIPAGNDSAVGTPYIASGSSIVQLALMRPDALQGKQLLDETGKPVGEINHIAKNIANQDLYAVIDMNSQHAQTAVKLDALSIAELAYLGDTGKLVREGFDEKDFARVPGQ